MRIKGYVIATLTVILAAAIAQADQGPELESPYWKVYCTSEWGVFEYQVDSCWTHLDKMLWRKNDGTGGWDSNCMCLRRQPGE